LSTHALGASESPTGLWALRHLDLVLLAIGLPVFAFAGLPLVGYAAVAGAWLLQWLIGTLGLQRAVEAGDSRAALGALAGGLVARIWLVGLAVLGAGLAEREAGVAAGIFALILFTVHFSTSLVTRPLESRP
jgi:hypothetical protein